jgi:hypothetical protein
MPVTTATEWVPASSASSSGCDIYSCTVTATKASDVDVPTTAAGTEKISGHKVAGAVSEEEEYKKVVANMKAAGKAAGEEVRYDVVTPHAAKLFAH